MPLIEASGITKIFGATTVLDGVSFTLENGQIHCLCGENGAGKSTLIKILSGAYVPDGGTITVGGTTYKALTPKIAKEKGVEVIHQENILVPQLSVAENIYTNVPYRTAGFFSMAKTNEAAANLMEQLGISLEPTEKVANLSAAQQQFVKILRAIAPGPNALILDEPTASFNMNDTEMVLSLVKRISTRGIGIIYISHHLKEVQTIADKVSVLRDGKLTASFDKENLDLGTVATEMVGRPIELFYERDDSASIGDTIFEVKNLRLKADTAQNNEQPIEFSLNKGEILGIAGMVGSGRSEIIRAVYGLDKCFSREIYKNGKRLSILSPQDSIKNGIGFISEDRQKSGLVLTLNILKNTTFLKLPKRFGLINSKHEEEIADKSIDTLSIKTDSKFKVTRLLSGGNQQKVIIAKWLHKGFDILILDEPTKGIDVKAKFEIYKLLHQLTAQGKSLIVVSSDMPELISLCNRVLVVRNGCIAAELSGSDITEEDVIKTALEVN